MGTGSPLVVSRSWFGHLEMEFEGEPLRSFYELLASRFQVVRYDRLGTGMSDRDRSPDAFTLDADLDVLQGLVEHLELSNFALYGTSYGGCVAIAFAARQPQRVRRLVLYGAYTNGAAISPEPVRASLLRTLRADWALGSRVMTGVLLPGADPRLARWFGRLQRESVSADLAAPMLDLVYRTDVRELLPAVTAPTLVLHRIDDRAIPVELGRELAKGLPNARLVELDGRLHQPWLGDAGAVVRHMTDFLGAAPPAPVAGDEPSPSSAESSALSPREVEVLRLVAAGLSDSEVARRLTLSRHTVHRHVANIRTKLAQPSRAGAAAYAARRGLI